MNNTEFENRLEYLRGVAAKRQKAIDELNNQLEAEKKKVANLEQQVATLRELREYDAADKSNAREAAQKYFDLIFALAGTANQADLIAFAKEHYPFLKLPKQ